MTFDPREHDPCEVCDTAFTETEWVDRHTEPATGNDCHDRCCPACEDETWFDQQTPCPECGHWCYDHCVCVTRPPADLRGVELIDPPCLCANEAHFTGHIAPVLAGALGNGDTKT